MWLPDLPADVRHLIFANLSLRDLSRCRRTSRTFRKLAPPVELCKDLLAAAAEGNAEVVGRLLAKGVPLSLARDARGLPALHIAAKAGHTEVVRLLLDARVPVDLCDAKGQTALHRAAAAAHYSVCALLIARGAPVDARTHKNASVLDLAVNLETRYDPQQYNVVKLLLEHGANPARPVQENRENPTVMIAAVFLRLQPLYELIRQYMPADHPEMALQPDWTAYDSD